VIAALPFVRGMQFPEAEAQVIEEPIKPRYATKLLWYSKGNPDLSIRTDGGIYYISASMYMVDGTLTLLENDVAISMIESRDKLYNYSYLTCVRELPKGDYTYKLVCRSNQTFGDPKIVVGKV
jgi:hypothetical protein